MAGWQYEGRCNPVGSHNMSHMLSHLVDVSFASLCIALSAAVRAFSHPQESTGDVRKRVRGIELPSPFFPVRASALIAFFSVAGWKPSSPNS